MTSRHRVIGRLALLIVALAALPVALTASNGVEANKACAEEQNGTCCPESRSVCGLNGVNYNNYYYKAEGPCN